MLVIAHIKGFGVNEDIEFSSTGEEIDRICIHDSYQLMEGWDSKGQRWTCSGYFCDDEFIEIPDDTDFECEELNDRKYLKKII